jgi:hypothetical protein
LTTSLIPDDRRGLQIDFDFIDHALILASTDGHRERIALSPMSVAEFYRLFLESLEKIGATAKIHSAPNEVPEPIPFARNSAPGAYDPDAVNRFWRALVAVDRVLNRFRTGFLGKSSPVHFFWGSFDLAVTRFSGRGAPVHPGGVPALPDPVTREAYSHEVSSAGFWPGGGPIFYPAFYSYAYPAPNGYSGARVRPEQARYDSSLGEFLLPYDAVRDAAEPEVALMAFLESTYDAAASLGKWDRGQLDCGYGEAGRPRAVPD